MEGEGEGSVHSYSNEDDDEDDEDDDDGTDYDTAEEEGCVACGEVERSAAGGDVPAAPTQPSDTHWPEVHDEEGDLFSRGASVDACATRTSPSETSEDRAAAAAAAAAAGNTPGTHVPRPEVGAAGHPVPDDSATGHWVNSDNVCDWLRVCAVDGGLNS